LNSLNKRQKQANTITFSILFFVLWPVFVHAQGLPATDIWLADLIDGELQQPQKINTGDGYNSQPHFSVDGQFIYYTKEQVGTDSVSQTDIAAYELESGVTEIVSHTDESEYSPTPVPGRNELSVIQGQRQLLVAIDIESGDSRVIFATIEPVGYHGWISEQEVAMFILGDTFTLQTAKLSDETGTVVAENIGRTIRKDPVTGDLLFVDTNTSPFQIAAFNPNTGEIRRIVPLFPESQDFTVDSTGGFWTGNGSKLYRRTAQDSRWVLIADLGSSGIRNISRLAIDPGDTRIALVSDHIE